MNILRKSCAVLHNVYVGLWVLIAELYWLAGPDCFFRRRQRAEARAIERCRGRLKTDDDLLVQAELEVLEAERTAAQAHHQARRSYFLEKLRRRLGFA